MERSESVFRSGIVDTDLLSHISRQTLNVSMKAFKAGNWEKYLRQSRRAVRLRREYYNRIGLHSRDAVYRFEDRKK